MTALEPILDAPAVGRHVHRSGGLLQLPGIEYDVRTNRAMMKRPPRYPTAVDPKRVGKYAALAGAGGGYVWDEVLEYRVWARAEGGDFFRAFATYPKALAFSRRTEGADEPLALIRQREYIAEPEPGRFIHVKTTRVTEWPVEFLSRPRRKRNTIPDFLSPAAPRNRLDILRGTSKP